MNRARATAAIISGLDSLSPGLTARVADQIWFTPRLLAPTRNGSLPEGAEAVSFPTGVATLHGYLAGSGAGTVLLVHGWAGSSIQMRAFVEPLVGLGHRVVAVDLPAHGSSPGRKTNVYEMTEALSAVAEQLGGVDVVVAHSMGALATAFALRDGLAVDGVVLLAPAVRLEHGLDRFRARLGFTAATEDRLRAIIAARFGDDIWDELRLDRLATEMTAPALIIHDTDDREIPHSHAVAVADAWNGAELETVTGPGHYRIVSDPAVVERAVSWISSRARRGNPVATARSSRPG